MNGGRDEQPAGGLGGYADEVLERMATENPELLTGLLLSAELTPWEATFGAEYLGQHCAATQHSELAIDTLVQLLAREPSALREGAVCGLRHLRCPRVDAALQARFASEPTTGVRDAIADTLAA